MNRDPNTRIGVKDKNEIKNDPFFKSIDWEKLARKEIEPPKFDPLDDEDEEPDLHIQPGVSLMEEYKYAISHFINLYYLTHNSF